MAGAWVTTQLPQRDRIVPRGQSPPGAGGAARELVVEPVRAAAPGKLELRWQSIPGAQPYQVLVFSPELRPVAVLAAGAETGFVLDPAGLTGASAHDTLLWRIAALRAGAKIAESHLETLRLP